MRNFTTTGANYALYQRLLLINNIFDSIIVYKTLYACQV